MGLTHRSNVGFISPGSSTRASFASNYIVTVYSVGGVVSEAVVGSKTSGTNIPVHQGHGLKVDDKILVDPGSDDRMSQAITAVTATTVTVEGEFPLSQGQVLVNLGNDSGNGTPAWDGSCVPIYSDPGGITAYINSTMVLGADGDYDYWYHGDGACWELFRDATGLNPSSIIAGWGSVSGRINVCDYGAKPGSTDSSTTAIEAAGLAVPADGGELYIPPGDYILGGRVDINRGNLRVVFARGARFIVDAEAITCLQIQGTIAAKLENVDVYDANMYDPDAAAHSGSEQTTGINVKYCDGVNIIRGKFYGLGDEAIVLNSCENWYVDSPIVEECCLTDSNSGSLSINGSYGGTINAPRITNNGTGSAIRIEVTNPPDDADSISHDINIVAPYIDTCRADIDPTAEDNGVGIVIATNNRTGGSVNIIGGVIKDPDKCGLFCNPITPGSGTMLSVQGLQVLGGGTNAKATAPRAAINVSELWTQVTIAGCLVDTWGSDATYHHGIRVAKDQSTIIGNTVLNVPNFGIYIDGDGATGNTIQGNYCPDGIRPSTLDNCSGNYVGVAPQALTYLSSTPSVSAGHVFTTNSNATLNNFQHGTVGQVIRIIGADTGTTLKFSTSANLIGNGNADHTFAVGDVATFVYNGTAWYGSIEAA